jgi:acyl carrier protein
MFSLAQLSLIASEVIGTPVHIEGPMTAIDIDGWDSLNNTLIALEISAKYNIDFNGEMAGQCRTFAEYVDFVRGMIEARDAAWNSVDKPT